MPTPAVSFNTTLNSPGISYGYGTDGSLIVFGNPVEFVSNWRKSRPASVSTIPKRKNGFREIRAVTDWSHVWSYCRVLPYSCEGIPIKSVPSGGIVRYVMENCFWRGFTGPAVDTPPSYLKSASEMKALSNLQQQNVDLGVFFAESKEAAETVSSTMRRIALEVSSFRTKNPKLWTQVLRHEDRARRLGRSRTRVNEIPSQWLALQYGWLPLLGDVNGIISLVDKTWRQSGAVVHVRGRKTTTTTLETPLTAWVRSSVSNPGINVGSSSILWETKHSGQVDLYYQMVNPTLAALSSLGLINPALIVWEKVPYSFVVDWFVPVSNWVNSLTAASGYNFITGCYGSKSVVTSYRRTPTIAVSGWNLIESFPIHYNSGGSGRFVRTRYTSSPVPGLYVKSPFSTKHVANALALLRNAFRR